MLDAPDPGVDTLAIRHLDGWYGASQVLHGVEFTVREGEVVTLLGRNGAGKTTTLRAIMGILRRRAGEIRYRGQDLIHERPDRIARRGIAFCPEERAIFSTLSVEENLLLPPVIQPGGMPLQELYQVFPNLLERRQSQGTKLSGGEQQMLAIARILRTGARVLLLDEPTEGLAPVIVQRIRDVILMLKQRSYTILLVEQNANFAAQVADRHYVIENGEIVEQFDRIAIATSAAQDKLRSYLSV